MGSGKGSGHPENRVGTDRVNEGLYDFPRGKKGGKQRERRGGAGRGSNYTPLGCEKRQETQPTFAYKAMRWENDTPPLRKTLRKKG